MVLFVLNCKHTVESHTCDFYYVPKMKVRRNILGILRISGQEINVLKQAVKAVFFAHHLLRLMLLTDIFKS